MIVDKIQQLLKRIKEPKFKSKVNKVFNIFIVIFVLTVIVNKAYAQVDLSAVCIDTEATYSDENTKSDLATGDENYDNSNSIATAGVSKLLSGVLATAPGALCNGSAITNSSELSPMSKLGLLGMVEKNIQTIGTPSGPNVYAHLVDQWVPGQNESASVYAQSEEGYQYLLSTGVDDLWQKFRLIAYVLFVIALIVAGFAIMFRHKIGGQLAVTIMNTLPEVIIGLILVTFSFAIVGLLLNAGALLTNVISGVLNVGGKALIVENPFSIFTGVLNNADWYTDFGLIAGGGGIALALAGILASPFTGGASLIGVVVGMIPIVLFLIVTGIIIVGSIKVYITLLKAYLGILLDTMLAPIFISISVAPGLNNLRSDWFKRVLKNVLTFPLVFFFINLGSFVFNQNFTLTFPTGLVGGNLSGGASPLGGDLLNVVLKATLYIYKIYLAAEVPKFLEDFLPSMGGKGAQAAMQGALKGAFGKIPIIGGMMG